MTLPVDANTLLPDPFAPGTVWGRYQLVRCIGRGGMGSVYEARHLDLGKRVAVKLLRPEVALQPTVRQRFLREGVAASRIRHAHVADVTDVGEQDGVPFLVMEYLEGESLADLLRREGPLSAERTADLLLPVCAAAQQAHEEGVVHRDLKPANIFLARDRYGVVVPKVLDFGVSKIALHDDEESQALTGTESLLGTPYYMSPEQVEGARFVGPPSDQFALGVVLYACVTRELPFRGPSAFATMQAIVQGAYLSPCARAPSLSPAFERVIQRALQRQPEARFPSLRDLGAALWPFASPAAQVLWAPVFGRVPGAELGAVAVPSVEDPPTTVLDRTLAPDVFRAPSTLSSSVVPRAERPGRGARWGLVVGGVFLLAAVAGAVALGVRGTTPPVASAVAAPLPAPSVDAAVLPPPAVVPPPPLQAPEEVPAVVAQQTPTETLRPPAPRELPRVAPRIVRPRVVRPRVERTQNGGTILE